MRLLKDQDSTCPKLEMKNKKHEINLETSRNMRLTIFQVNKASKRGRSNWRRRENHDLIADLNHHEAK